MQYQSPSPYPDGYQQSSPLRRDYNLSSSGKFDTSAYRGSQVPAFSSSYGAGQRMQASGSYTNTQFARTGGRDPEDIKDRIVQTLRNEIRNHQVKDRDYAQLVAIIKDLEMRAKKLEHNIDEGQREYENKINEQKDTIE